MKTAPLVGPVEKTAGEDGVTYRALVSSFGTKDLQGEIVDKGAFSASLSERGQVRPVMWSHQHNDVRALIGVTRSIEETDDGLVVEWSPAATPEAAVVSMMLDSGAITDYSFAAVVRDYADDEDEVTHLTDLDLIEVGPTLRGANPAAGHLGRADDDHKPDADGDEDDKPDADGDDDDTIDDERARKARARLALVGLITQEDA